MDYEILSQYSLFLSGHTLLAVHCHVVYEVVVSTSASPGTHVGW